MSNELQKFKEAVAAGAKIHYVPIDPGRMEGDPKVHGCRPNGPFEHGENDGYPPPCQPIPPTVIHSPVIPMVNPPLPNPHLHSGAGLSWFV